MDGKERKNPIVIVIDGIIAAGKTTLIKNLSEILECRGYQVTPIYEPVEKWEELISKCGEDGRRYSYHLQSKILHDRYVEYERCKDKTVDIFLLERSIYTDKIFAGVARNDGLMTDLEWSNYLEQWDTWKRISPFKINHFVWLNPSLELCMDRYYKRSRECESVTVDYQEKIRERHERFYSFKKCEKGYTHILNWDFDFSSRHGREIAADEFERIIHTTEPIAIE